MIAELVTRNLQFIYWPNFVKPQVYAAWLVPLAFTLLFLWFCVLAGHLVAKKARYLSATEDLVLNFAAGAACVSSALGVLALIHASTGWAVGALAAATVVLSLRSGAPASALGTLRRALAEEKALVFLFLLCSFPSALPPYRYDEVSYHLPYVLQWVQQHGLTVDPTMRHPLYTFNFHMLQMLGMMARSTTFVHLVVWLFGSVGCLAVLTFSRRLGVRNGAAVLCALAFYLSPLVQRYLNVFFIDVPLMSLSLLAVYGIYYSRQAEAARPYLTAAALVAALFVGTKITGIFFVPLFLALAWFGRSRRDFWRFVLVLAVFGSVWYLRNFWIDGDPIPPVLNILRHRADLYWTPQDYHGVRAEIVDYGRYAAGNLRPLLTFPLRLVTGLPEDAPLQGFVLFIPFTLTLLPSLWKKRQADVVLALWFALGFWLASATRMRYAHFAALAAVAAGTVVEAVLRRIDRYSSGVAKVSVLALAGALLLGPNLNIPSYFKNNFNRAVVVDDASYRSFYAYLGLPAVQLIDRLASLGLNGGALYTFGYDDLKYYYNLKGFRLVGDHINRFRYADMKQSLLSGSLYPFLREAGVDGAVFRTDTLTHFELTQAHVRQAVIDEPRLKLVYEDAGSIVIKLR